MPNDTPLTDKYSFYSGDHNEGQCVVQADFAEELERNLRRAIQIARILGTRCVTHEEKNGLRAELSAINESLDPKSSVRCGHCGAEITTIKNNLGHSEYGCGNWSDCVSQSELCREREARQKAEAEVERLDQMVEWFIENAPHYLLSNFNAHQATLPRNNK